ncbi:MAG: pyruvate dehydrogenase complex dihydrolipoamide acetyltransferase [Bacteroidota bacterium]
MAEIVRMPKLSDTREEGVVAEWHKKVGDEVSTGDVLAEIETDKATMEFESFQDGVLLHIGVETGETAAVDSILAILGEKGENIDDLLKEGAAPSASAKEESAAPAPEPTPAPAPVAEAAPAPTSTPAPAPQPVAASSNGRVKASPLARSIASEKGIDLAAVHGTGDGGRIIKRDIESYTPMSRPAAATMAVAGQESYREEKVSQMRKVIARRLSESKFGAPHFYLTMEIDMANAMASRKAINAAIEPAKISFNDMVIKAAAVALKKHPAVNASWLGDTIRYNDHVNVGVAVAVDEGLLVPVVKFADAKPMAAINAEVREMAGKARNKKLQPNEMEGNTFTISNLGMFGIEEFTAIINPPDACIMAVGTIVEKPVVKNGQIVVGHTMKVTLSCDHRVVDGAVGSAFLQTFKKYMENPVLMLAD